MARQQPVRGDHTGSCLILAGGAEKLFRDFRMPEQKKS
jgi:hypothetical protein